MSINLKSIQEKRKNGTLRRSGKSGGGVSVPSGIFGVKIDNAGMVNGFKNPNIQNLKIECVVTDVESIDEETELSTEEIIGKKFNWYFTTNTKDVDFQETLIADLVALTDALGFDGDDLLGAEDVENLNDVYVEFLLMVQKKLLKKTLPEITLGREHQAKDPSYFNMWIVLDDDDSESDAEPEPEPKTTRRKRAL